MIFKYYINIDERGDFNADVRAPDGRSVFEIHDIDHMWELTDAGYMRDKNDLDGLLDYLYATGVLNDDDRLVSGN